MSLVDDMWDAAKGAAAGVAVVTALPIFGAVGTITTVGTTVASTVGAIASLVDDDDD